MKFVAYITFLICLAGPVFMLSQTKESAMASTTVNNKAIRASNSSIVFKKQQILSDVVQIDYELPFGGMIEFRLYDGTRREIWRTQATNTSGANKISLKTSKFAPGKTYHYAIYYKQDSITQSITVAPSNFPE